MEFGKRHDTTDTTDFCPRQLVMDLSYVVELLRTCCGETDVMDFGLCGIAGKLAVIGKSRKKLSQVYIG